MQRACSNEWGELTPRRLHQLVSRYRVGGAGAAAHETGAGKWSEHSSTSCFLRCATSHWPQPTLLPRLQGCSLTGWKYPVQSVASSRWWCGAGAARAGIIVRGKPDKLDLSRGLICLDTNKIYKYTLRIKILNLDIYLISNTKGSEVWSPLQFEQTKINPIIRIPMKSVYSVMMWCHHS